MKRNIKFALLFISITLSISLGFQSCIDDEVGDNFYTFTGDNILSYLEKDSLGQFSEVLKAIEKAELKGLFSSYGTYTFFAPNDDAFRAFYAKNNTNIEALSREELKEILYYHLVKKEFLVADFGEGLLPSTNMVERYLNITFSAYQEGEKVILVNQKVPIVLADQETHNGVIHGVGGVLEPSDMFLAEKIEESGFYTVFHKALVETGLSDSLMLVKDENYGGQIEVAGYNGTWKTPPTRNFGFTAFVESDKTFAKEGIHSFEDLVQKAKEMYVELYGEEESSNDFTNRNNSLNLFVAYHLFEQMSDASGLVDRYYKTRHTTDFGSKVHVEYIPTLRHRSILEVKTGNLINQRSDGSCVKLVDDLTRINVDCWNGIYHEIDKVLWYDKEVEDDVLNKRLRIDFGSINPELANNALRENMNYGAALQNGYMKYSSLGDDPSALLYIKYGNNDWTYFQGDGITINGWYDLIVQTPPLPPGTWEIRVGVITYAGGGTLKHGLAQLYFDNEPLGIPMNFGLNGKDPLIGWISDSETDDEGAANDRAMRNRGWMKAPDTYGQPSGGITARQNSSGPFRRILTTINVTDRDKPHYFRAKALENTLLDLDFFEFVPKSALENEDKH